MDDNMLKYQSKLEKQFYDRMFKITPHEIRQYNEGRRMNKPPYSIDREANLKEILSNLLIEIIEKIEKKQLPSKQVQVVDKYLANAIFFNSHMQEEYNCFNSPMQEGYNRDIEVRPKLCWILPKTELNISLSGELIKELQSHREEITPSSTAIDPLALIEPILMSRFLKAEKKAIGETGRFEVNVRCAAFCELLSTKKYIIPTKTRVITMCTFAKARYGLSISNALAASKKDDRKKHINNKVKGLIPLKNCF